MAKILLNKEQWIICSRNSSWIYNDAHNNNDNEQQKPMLQKFFTTASAADRKYRFCTDLLISLSNTLVRRMAIHIRFEWQGQSFVRLNWKLQLFGPFDKSTASGKRNQLIQHIDDFAGCFLFVNCLLPRFFYALLLPFQLLSALLGAIASIGCCGHELRRSTITVATLAAAAVVVTANSMKFFCGFDCERANVPDGLNQNRRPENDIHFHFTAVNLEFIFSRFLPSTCRMPWQSVWRKFISLNPKHIHQALPKSVSREFQFNNVTTAQRTKFTHQK